MLKRVLAGVVAAIMTAGAAVAGPWEDGVYAYQRASAAITRWPFGCGNRLPTMAIRALKIILASCMR